MKKLLGRIGVLAVLILFCTIPVLAAASVKIIVNDQEVIPDTAPFISGGRVMVPARAILEPLGAWFEWDSKSKTVSIHKESKNVLLIINRNNAAINGVKYPLDAPAVIKNGRTFIPLRFVSEAFDAYVDWNANERLVKVIQNAAIKRPLSTVTGYYYDFRSLESLQNYMNLITDTVHFSYELNSDGRVEEKPFFSQGFELARQNNKGVEMLVFANNREQLKMILDNPVMQQQIIEDIFSFVEVRGFDGVNMDFEYVDKTQAKQYTNFIQALRNKLGARYTLSLSVPARSSEREWWHDGYDYPALAAIVDRIMVMAYDQHYGGGSPGPVAGCDWAEQVINYLLPLIPREKFQLGLGIYGYDWPETGKGKAIYVQAARDLAQAKGAVIKIDQVSGVSWFSYTDDSGIPHQVWFEDVDSLRTKLELVKKYDLAGIALWRLGIIPQDIWDVIADYKGTR